jgi:large subunit ribosomal protein L6
MSRIGKKPIILPSGFDATVEAGKVLVKAPKGSLTVTLPPHTAVAIDGEPKAVTVTVQDPENVTQRAIWGLTRQLIANAVIGLQTPFQKQLEFNGVGYRVAIEGKNVAMDVGYSHRVMFPIPEGISASVDKQVLTLVSADKYLLGETAAQIRRVRPPEPYKGKGIKYMEEVIRRKAGKTAKAA